MRNSSISFLARRFIRGQQSRYISKGHILTVAGIALGVLALISVSSVMNGFRQDMQTRIIGTLSEIRITSKDGSPVTNYEEIIKVCEEQGFDAAPIIRMELLLKKDNVIEPTMSFGVDLDRQTKVSTALLPISTKADSKLRQGLIGGEANSTQFEESGIILGSGLAYRLNANLGDEIQILSPMFSEPTAFGLLPKIRTLKVIGIFIAGMPEYDMMFSYIPLGVARFFGNGHSGVDFVEVKTGSYHKLKLHTSRLARLLPDYEVKDWSSFDPSLYNAIRFEKVMMFVVMLFMYVIACFNLTGNLIKTIAQKKKELGLLKAIGFKESDLRNLFMLHTLILSTLGIVIGLLMASTLLMLQKQFDIIKLTLSPGDFIALPVSFEAMDFVIVILVAYLISIISTLFPLRQLKSIDTIELIRQSANG